MLDDDIAREHGAFHGVARAGTLLGIEDANPQFEEILIRASIEAEQIV